MGNLIWKNYWRRFSAVQFSSIQLLSCVWFFGTPWTAVCLASMAFTNFRSLFKLMSIELVIPSNHLILCRPLLLLTSVFLSIRVFSNESVLHIRWPKCWVSASASVLPMTIQDWFPLDSLVGSPCSPRDFQESSPTPQSSKASILWCSAFFIVQLSYLYMTTGKTIALTIGKVMSLLFCLGLTLLFFQRASVF